MTTQKPIPAITAVAKASAAAAAAKRAITVKPDVDVAKVKPFSLTSFTPGDFMLHNGFPEAPPIWTKIDTLVSSTGEYLDYKRDDPTDVDIPCHSRWIANDATMDQISGRWNPAYTEGADYYFIAPAGFAPNVEQITYTVGKELIDATALSFAPGDLLNSSFNNGVDDAVEWSIVMVGAMHAPLSYTLLSTPPEVPDITIGVSLKFGLTVEDPLITKKIKDLVTGVESIVTAPLKGMADTPALPSNMEPVYIILSRQPPKTVMTVATGLHALHQVVLNGKSTDTTDMKWILGGSNSQFHLMEFALFDYSLNRTDSDSETLNVFEALHLFSSIYGAR